MVVGHDIARGIDDKARAQRDPPRLAPRVLRKLIAAALVLLLIEKAAQHFIERRVWKSLKRGCLILFLGHLVGSRFLGDRDVDDRGQHLFDQRGEALLLDQRHRRGHRLRRRGRDLRRIFGPHHRRQRQCRAESKGGGGGAAAGQPGKAGFAIGGVCHFILLSNGGCSRRSRTAQGAGAGIAGDICRPCDMRLSRGLIRRNLVYAPAHTPPP